MSRDVVIFRAERIVARLSVSGWHERTAVAPASDPSTPASIEDLETGPDRSDTLADRLEAAGARWRQLTFYLFHPDSWR
jgi:hypothetical protein